MIIAISPPKVQFNPTTNTWEVINRPDLVRPPTKQAPATPCSPVFSGDKEAISAPWWNDCRGDTPKNWKHQSVRARQYRPK